MVRPNGKRLCDLEGEGARGEQAPQGPMLQQGGYRETLLKGSSDVPKAWQGPMHRPVHGGRSQKFC